jgi:hypothetical protein
LGAVTELPDLRRVGHIALDIETRDDRLRNELGSGWPFRQGHICGVSVAYRAEDDTRGLYFPIHHPDTQNFDPERVYQWVRDHIATGVRFVTQNGLYDWGWLRAEANIRMPPSEQIEEIGALATMVDENRFKYSLDALCAWRGLPGKDDTLLRQGIKELSLIENKRRKLIPQNHIWQLPARYVGPYAETDAVNTLRLFEDLNPILDREGTRAAYRLECDLLPMVLEMRLRGIRVDLDAAARAHDLLLSKRDAALAELSKEIGCAVSMHEIQGRKWLVDTFEREKVAYPRTKTGNPSFTGGKLGWMVGHTHWLPRLIAVASKYNKAAVDFLQVHIIRHCHQWPPARRDQSAPLGGKRHQIVALFLFRSAAAADAVARSRAGAADPRRVSSRGRRSLGKAGCLTAGIPVRGALRQPASFAPRC